MPGLWNFTAVGGALLYFGARRPWREMLAPLAALMATDCLLTVCVYHFSFHLLDYALTWAWYLMAMALGQILLHSRTSFARVTAGTLLGPTSFFVLSNFAAGALLAHPPPGKANHRQAADDGQQRQSVVRHQIHRARTQLEHQQREHQPADHAAAEDGQHERRDPHLEDAGGKDEGLPGRGRGQHGGNHHGQELLALEAGAHPLVALRG
jgi:hypothetical protein